MTPTERLKELTSILQKASYAYYGQDNPIMSDKEYDDLYDELELLEKQLGCVLAGSPTTKVQGYIMEGLAEVKHTKPMLSAKKTKDLEAVAKHLGENAFYCSYKLDGLTLVVRYKDGQFIQGITRGDGEIGEDVTEQCKFIKNLPMQIPLKGDVELRGECVIRWEEFDRINANLPETEKQYKHPRNLAAGTIRKLDLNVVKSRDLNFIAFEVVSPLYEKKTQALQKMEECGFECVPRMIGSVAACHEQMTADKIPYPVDGLIFEINDTQISKSLGETDHHENCRIALKWEDTLYKTTLRDIVWQPSKTGLINPVAVFDPVDLDGAITTRATLHNLSFIEKLQLGIGDEIQVYRANMVIPKIHESLTKSGNFIPPEKCPCCNAKTEIHTSNDSKTLYCPNEDCSAKLIKKLVHAVKKNALDIDGCSEATLEFLVEKGWVTSIKDLYHLDRIENEWKTCEGFGEKSVGSLMHEVDLSRSITLDRFLSALSIPLIGNSASKDIAKFCNYDFDTFARLVANGHLEELLNIPGFGESAYVSLKSWMDTHWIECLSLSQEFSFESVEKSEDEILSGKTFVITGSLVNYKNRDELVEVIESLGGKVAGSVSSKTNYLINNDATSTSGKNKKAKDLHIPIITEEEFMELFLPNQSLKR